MSKPDPKPSKSAILEELGQKVHFLKREVGYQVKEIADVLKIDDGNLLGYLKGKSVSRKKLKALLDELNSIYAVELAPWVLDTEHSYREYDNTPMPDGQVNAGGPNLKDVVMEQGLEIAALKNIVLRYLGPSCGRSQDELAKELEDEKVALVQKKNP